MEIKNARHNDVDMNIVKTEIKYINGYYHYVGYNKDGIGLVCGIAETYDDAIERLN